MAPPPPNLARMRAPDASAWRRRWRRRTVPSSRPPERPILSNRRHQTRPRTWSRHLGHHTPTSARLGERVTVGNGLTLHLRLQAIRIQLRRGLVVLRVVGHARVDVVLLPKAATSSSFDECVIILSCLSDHESMVTDRTKLMCTPMPLWAPEHSRHMSAPYVTEAHCGWFEPQSTHLSLPGNILISACMAGVMETAIFFAGRLAGGDGARFCR